jgi:hypothetical protein
METDFWLYRSLIWKPPPHFGTFFPTPNPQPISRAKPTAPLRLIIRLGKAGADQVQIGESQVG